MPRVRRRVAGGHPARSPDAPTAQAWSCYTGGCCTGGDWRAATTCPLVAPCWSTTMVTSSSTTSSTSTTISTTNGVQFIGNEPPLTGRVL